MGNALPKKYRPQDLDEIFGNTSTVKALQAYFAKPVEDRAQAILLTGPSGCGKTTIARIFKTALGVSDHDYYEYNASNTRGIDTIRELQANCRLSAIGGSIKLYLLDEAHELTGNAQNAALKMLEEAPPGVFFILATTDPQKLKETIHTRCATFTVAPLTTRDSKMLLNAVLDAERITDMWPEVLDEIVKSAEGLPRELLKLLDTVLTMEDMDAALKTVQSSSVADKTVIDICQFMLNMNKKDWVEFGIILKGVEEEPEKVRRGIRTYLSKVLLRGLDDYVAAIMECFSNNYMYDGKDALILSCYGAHREKIEFDKDDVPF